MGWGFVPRPCAVSRVHIRDAHAVFRNLACVGIIFRVRNTRPAREFQKNSRVHFLFFAIDKIELLCYTYSSGKSPLTKEQ